MKVTLNYFEIEKLDEMFELAFVTLHEKGYNVDRLCAIRGSEFYDMYKELPMDFVTFKGFAQLPNVPYGFELAHIMDEKFSMLFYRYEDNLSREQVLHNKTILAESLFIWAELLPDNKKRKGVA